MIDRIKFYIDDVDLDDIEKRLSLYPAGIAKDESVRYAVKYKNLDIVYVKNWFQISGSLL